MGIVLLYSRSFWLSNTSDLYLPQPCQLTGGIVYGDELQEYHVTYIPPSTFAGPVIIRNQVHLISSRSRTIHTYSYYIYIMPKLHTVLVLLKLSESALSSLKSTFSTVHYFPPSSSPPPTSVLEQIDILFGPPQRLSEWSIETFHQLPKLKYIQLGSAGADGPLKAPAVKAFIENRDGDSRGGGREIKMMTASGTHVLSIPPWAVGCVIMLYHQIPRMLGIARVCPLPYDHCNVIGELG
jgi:hypothetical protein